MKAKIKVLIRRIKRSIKTDRDKWIKGAILAVILILIAIFLGNCACGKKKAKEPDEAAQGVMKISPIPTPTPTEAPRQVSADAVATSGNVTMVNEYLVQKEENDGAGSADNTDNTATSSGTNDGTDDDTDNGTDDGAADETEGEEAE